MKQKETVEDEQAMLKANNTEYQGGEKGTGEEGRERGAFSMQLSSLKEEVEQVGEGEGYQEIAGLGPDGG